MRQIATIADATHAQRFADYLLTLGIQARVDASSTEPGSGASDSGSSPIWIRDEEQVEQAKAELATFLANPDDPRYQAAEGEARTKRQQLERKQQQAARNVVDMQQRWAPVTSGAIPATLILIGICVLVAVLTRGGGYFAKADDPPSALQQGLMFSEIPSTDELIKTVAEGRDWGLEDIRRGQVWRLVTPILLHFGPLHLLFNMLMLRDLGGLVEARRGLLRYLGIVLLVAVTSNFGQYYFTGNPFFGGMSGVVYGLFGYAWMKSRFDPTSGIFVHPNTVTMLLIWFFVCLFGLVGNIANWAHGIGLLVGMAVGYLPVAVRRWRR